MKKSLIAACILAAASSVAMPALAFEPQRPVEFVVTAEGRVVNVIAVDTTHHGFNDSAIKAVGKWKFKPGVKNGRKVNTRMAVPINFNIIPNS